MANTEIDSLSLEIEIKGLNDKDIANLDKLSKAVARLSKSLKDADFSKLKNIEVPKGLKNIPVILNQTINAKLGGSDTQTTMAETQQKVKEVTTAINEQTGALQENDLEIQKADSFFGKYIEKIKQSVGVFFGFRKAVKQPKKELSGLQKLLKRFKTIAFIKAVRRILNAIVQAVQKGIQNLALFDKSFNDTISSIKTSATNITNALTLTIRPLIETLEPFIANLSNALVNVGNTISKLQAQTKGLSTYTKINAKYTEDYAKSLQKANLFSFDTFNSIDTQNGMFEEASIDEESVNGTEEIAETLIELQNTLGMVLELVGSIFGLVGDILKVLSPILSSLMKLINGILRPIINLLKIVLEALSPIFDIVYQLIEPLFDIIDGVLSPILDVINEIVLAVKPILDFVVEILQDLFSINNNQLSQTYEFLENIIPLIKLVTDAVKDVVEKMKSSLQVTKDVYDLVMAIVNFDFDSLGEKWNKLLEDVGKHIKNVIIMPIKLVLRLIDVAINNTVKMLNVFLKPFSKIRELLGNSSLQIDFESNLTGSFSDWINNLSFADGGIVGELWQMNEYGVPEMLYNANNSGNTAVITQDQLARAFEQAIYNTGILDMIQSSGNLYLDGKEIAQSQRFKNELNRTNPSLNIR